MTKTLCACMHACVCVHTCLCVSFTRPATLEFLGMGPQISMSFSDDPEVFPPSTCSQVRTSALGNRELQQAPKTSWEII